MDKLVLLKYAAVLALILFISLVGLGLILNTNLLISLGLVLFALGSGLLTYYLVTTRA